MSNRAHHRPGPKRPDRRLIRDALLLSGCTCVADVRHVHKSYVQLRHDPGCPALNAGRMIFVIPNEPGPEARR